MSERVDGFRDWLERAKPGDRKTYHVGQLAVDRLKAFDAFELDCLAKDVWFAWESGWAHLMQRRIGGTFEYIAEKRK